jgi:hypothetical protein
MMHQLGPAPRVVSLASSRRGQNSYSYITDHALGVALTPTPTPTLSPTLTLTLTLTPTPNPDPDPDPNQVALSDRFSFHLHRFLMWRHEQSGRAVPPTVGDALGALSPRLLNSHVQLGSHGAGRTCEF